MRKLVIAAIALGAALAFAGTVNITDMFVFQTLFRPWTRTTTQLAALTPSAYTGYVAYDSTKGAVAVSNGTAWVSSGLNVLATASTTYDFPALGATNTTDANVVQCARSKNVTATGAAIGHRCEAASNFGADGGSVLPTYVHLTCLPISANTIAFDLCAQINDGGTYDATDAGYFATVFN